MAKAVPPRTDEADAAHLYVRAWADRAALLESERLHRLRTLTESDAARMFATLLQGPAVFRPDSGLATQRIFSRLRRKPE